MIGGNDALGLASTRPAVDNVSLGVEGRFGKRSGVATCNGLTTPRCAVACNN
jgi:hypothetical protein